MQTTSKPAADAANDDVALLLEVTEQNIQRGWTKGAMFRDADGNRIELFEDNAAAFTHHLRDIRRGHLEPASCCTMGALLLAAHDSGASAEVFAAGWQALRKANHGKSIVDFNDDESTTKEQAIDLVRAARLALLKG